MNTSLGQHHQQPAASGASKCSQETPMIPKVHRQSQLTMTTHGGIHMSDDVVICRTFACVKLCWCKCKLWQGHTQTQRSTLKQQATLADSAQQYCWPTLCWSHAKKSLLQSMLAQFIWGREAAWPQAAQGAAATNCPSCPGSPVPSVEPYLVQPASQQQASQQGLART